MDRKAPGVNLTIRLGDQKPDKPDKVIHQPGNYIPSQKIIRSQQKHTRRNQAIQRWHISRQLDYGVAFTSCLVDPRVNIQYTNHGCADILFYSPYKPVALPGMEEVERRWWAGLKGIPAIYYNGLEGRRIDWVCLLDPPLHQKINFEWWRREIYGQKVIC
jgi:hypothetical protein